MANGDFDALMSVLGTLMGDTKPATTTSTGSSSSYSTSDGKSVASSHSETIADGQSSTIKKSTNMKIDKNKVKYVIGIDFGHGETSAAKCTLEWGKSAGQRENIVKDLYVDEQGSKKVIPSAICIINGLPHIGDEAFEHMTDNQGLRISFKQKPQSIDGEAEQLMIQYMSAVYGRIRERDTDLTDDNHIVYIARPSGWTDEKSKELYRQMAREAGIPLAGLTSESRAAIFYAKSPAVNFTNQISKGAIVFDLGSSTLDFTYLSDKDKPYDYGYPLGASIIDEAVFEGKIANIPVIAEFLKAYPEYKGSLLFKARQFKESAYSRPTSKTDGSFFLKQVIPDETQAYEDFGRTPVDLFVKSLDELNELIEEKKHYQSKLREAVKDFVEKKNGGKKIKGVFLTGGASRMNFIIPLISEAIGLDKSQIKIDGDDPSLTISRGIALLGATDAITDVLVEQLRSEISKGDTKNMTSDIANIIGFNVAFAAMAQVEATCSRWVKHGQTTDREELQEWLKKDLQSFQFNGLKKTVSGALMEYTKNQSKVIRDKMNDIIRRYSPDHEIVMDGNMQVGDLSAISESLKDLSAIIDNICNDISQYIVQAMWAALGAILFGMFIIPYYALKALLTSDESKRKDKVKKILDQKLTITNKVRESIISKLKEDASFTSTISKTMGNYFSGVIESNLEKVKIPIE